MFHITNHQTWSFGLNYPEIPDSSIFLKFWVEINLLNSSDDTNSSGWEPADDANTENSVLSLMMIDDLINEVSIKYSEAKAIFSLLMEDPQISRALKQVDLKKGKNQAYDYVKKMQSYAKELYNKNYR